MTGTRRPRYDLPPVRDIILNDGRTLTGFARTLKTDTSHALLAFAGRVTPSPQLRAELVARLGLPIEVLFPKEALAEEYQAKRRTRGQRCTC